MMEQCTTERLQELQIRADSQVEKHRFLFRWGRTPCFARGELVAMTGKAKSGKTFVSSMLMATAIGGSVMDIRREEEAPYSVVWIDTEQSEDSTQEIMVDRIARMAGVTVLPEQLRVYNLRKVAWQDRQHLVEMAIVQAMPDLVIFDGIRDIVGDINDFQVAQSVLDRFLSLASFTQACIVCVLHQNKAAEDKTLRGALGTELQNKSYETYECTKDLDSRDFKLRQTATRKYDITQPLHFMVNEEGLPYPCLPQAEEGTEKADFQPGQMADDRHILKAIYCQQDEMRAYTLKFQLRRFGITTDTQYLAFLARTQRSGMLVKRQVPNSREVFYVVQREAISEASSALYSTVTPQQGLPEHTIGRHSSEAKEAQQTIIF